MNLRKATGNLGLMTLAALSSPLATAQESAWYLGGNLGRAKATIDDAKITASLLSSGFITTSMVTDNRDSGYKLYGGYQFSKHFAFEAGFFDLGRYSFTSSVTPLGSLSGSIKLRGVNLDLVGRLPITDNFSVFGRVGANHAEARDNFAGTGLVRVIDPSPSKRDTNLKVGLGLQYDFSPHFSVRAEVERYRIDDAIGNKGDIDMVSLGLLYRFHAPQRRTAWAPPAPAPVSYTPPAHTQAPVEAVAAAPPSPPMLPAQSVAAVQQTRVTFSADALFDFDRSVIRPAGKAELDKFATDVSGTRFDSISVVGHTDRIGTQAYNQLLSTRRADAVKAYLVNNGRLPANVITATGVNGSAPVTKPGDCVGNTATAALIACLQPDRRVEVEVTGTR